MPQSKSRLRTFFDKAPCGRASLGRLSTLPFALAFAVLILLPTVASADWLVTHDGQRIRTQGPWQEKGRMIVFTSQRGTLSSMRLDEVDLDASRALSAQARQTPGKTSDAPAAQRPSVMILTNQDVARGEGGVEGAQALVERIRLAHQFKDIPSVLGLVHWQDTPQGIRDYMETQFEWMMQRRIRDIQLSEVGVDDQFTREVDGVIYEPNVEVSHELVIDFVPDPDADELVLRLFVGPRLGAYFIAAARPIEDF